VRLNRNVSLTWCGGILLAGWRTEEVSVPVGRMVDEALFADLSLDELTRRVLAVGDRPRLRSELIAEYGRLVGYRSLIEWNRLVRVCELLAVIGWGEDRPVEAVADKWINGRYYTELRDAIFATVPDTSRGWLRRGDTFVVEDGPELVDPGVTVFARQRNPLPKNPLRIARSGNYQPSVQPFVDEVARLRHVLDARLAKSYGLGFSYVGITLAFSYREQPRGPYCDYFHSAGDVPSGFRGKAYVRPRLDVGRLSKHQGETRLVVTRHYTWAEGEVDLQTQKRILAEEFVEIIDILRGRLAKANPGYQVQALRSDTEAILAGWLEH
jgi:hypothetical protein